MPIDKIAIEQYLNGDIFYYFKHFAPVAARLIRKLAHDNPKEFLRLLAEHELPDMCNVSDWDTITDRVFERVELYESEEQQEEISQTDQDVINVKNTTANIIENCFLHLFNTIKIAIAKIK